LAAVTLIITNRAHAGVIGVAASHGVPAIVIPNDEISTRLLEDLQGHHIDFVVLAGFLRKIPDAVVKAYHHRIINIHPALLPDFGGKGMYGNNVHEAVIRAGKKESGITIHLVNEAYDEGDIIFQASCLVYPDDTAESLAAKIHILEHRHFPQIIENQIKNIIS
jgi:phosphoribosylglycinamide formyltransferase-1